MCLSKYEIEIQPLPFSRMSSAVHFTHGGVSGAVLRELYPRDHTIVLNDCLSMGPVISITDEQGRTQTRSDFWRKFLWNLKDRPPVEVEGDTGAMRTTRFRLTEMGRKVLAGEANRVELNGIDEWIGGVHLKAPRVRPGITIVGS